MVLEAVVVTAQRRSEDMQDVPISISAVTAEQLKSAGIQTTADLSLVSPGLTIGNTSGFLRPHIRGVGTTSVGAGLENSIATYIDGVYIASQPAALMSLGDIQQVEVLKGPQGTLFGRNATGGVIHVITQQPTDSLEGSASVDYGNYDLTRASLLVSGPLADTLGATFAARVGRQGEGYGKNLFNGKDIHDTDLDLSLRGKLRWDLSDLTSITVALDHSKLDSTAVLVGAPRGAARQFAPPFTGGDYDVDMNVQPSRVVTGSGGSLQVQHDFGPLALTSISAYRTLEFDQTLDGDAGPTSFAILDYVQKDRQVSQEFQLASTGDSALTWVAGLYYFKLESDYDPYEVRLATVTQHIESTQEAESYAAFAQGTYQLTDADRLTIGLRYTDETRTVSGIGQLRSPAGAVLNALYPPQHHESDYNPFTWRISLDHRFQPDLLGYVSYSRGFKSGGFNAQTPAAVGFDPEYLDAYEVGIKSVLFDQRLKLNVAGFYYDYQDMQVSTYILGPTSQIYNGAESELYGLDADLEFKATADLSVTFGMSINHARFSEFPAAVVSRVNPATPSPTTPSYLLGSGSAKDNHLPFTPDQTFTLGLDYARPVTGGTIQSSLFVQHSGSYFTEPDNRLKQTSYETINATLGFASANDTWFVRLWGRNLADETVKLQHLTATYTEGVAYAPPRTYGVTVGYNF